MAGNPRRGFVQRAFIACFAGLTAAAVLLIFWYAADVLLLVFAGALLAVLFNGLTRQVSSRLKLPYRPCYGFTLLALAALVGGLGWFAAGRLSGEVEQLTERLPRAANQLMERLEQNGLAKRLIDEAPQPGRFLRNQRDLLQRATGVVSSTLSAITSGFVILFIGLYLGFDPELYKRGVLQLFAPERRSRAAAVLDKLGQTLWWWLLAHFASMSLVGVLTTVGLFALGVPLAIVLGLIAAALAFIPNIGPILSAIPAILIAVSESPEKAWYVILLYIAVQAVETNFISPVFQQKAVSLPPALTMSVQLLMGTLVGILGLLVASPICAAGIVLAQMLYVEDRQT